MIWLLVVAQLWAAEKVYTKSEARNLVCGALCAQEGADTGYWENKTDYCVCGYRRTFSGPVVLGKPVHVYTANEPVKEEPPEPGKRPWWH